MNDGEQDLKRYIGRKSVENDVATAFPVRAMWATLGRNEDPPADGEAVAPGWHGLYFLPSVRPEALGPDGLAPGAGVLPPMPFPRRMFAGERLRFHRPIRIGDPLTRESELIDVTLKQGSTGRLGFTTVAMRISGPDGLCLEEERDSVFREEVKGGAKNPTPRPQPAPGDAPWTRTIKPDPVMLFRYSALTFNGHRIHYDRGWATEVEGYPGLVVHGPLLSSLLIDFARDHNPGRTITAYHMRARAPLFDTDPFTLVGRPSEDGASCEVWAVTPDGAVAMSASATFQ